MMPPVPGPTFGDSLGQSAVFAASALQGVVDRQALGGDVHKKIVSVLLACLLVFQYGCADQPAGPGPASSVGSSTTQPATPGQDASATPAPAKQNPPAAKQNPAAANQPGGSGFFSVGTWAAIGAGLLAAAAIAAAVLAGGHSH